MAGSFPLVETAIHEKNPVLKKVYEGRFMGKLPRPTDFIPRETVPNFAPKSLHLTHTDRPTFRNLNAAAGSYRVKYADREQTVKIIQDTIVIDVEQTEVEYLRDPVDLQLTEYGKALGSLENDILFNGNPGDDDTVPAGLFYRFANDALLLGQAVDANALAVNTNDATRASFLLLLDEAIELAGGGAPDLMAMNRQTWRIFRASLRNSKLLDTTRDQFDRMIYEYGGVKFVNPGLKPENELSAAESGQILRADQTTSLFDDASTSQIFIINTKGDEGLRLLQVHGLKEERLGQNPNNPTEVVNDVRSTMGIFLPSTFCVSILDGLDIV